MSGGNFNHFTSHVVRQLMESGELAAFVASPASELRERGRRRWTTALRKHLGGVASWQKPLGGYFFWLELPEGADAANSRSGGARGRHRFPARAAPAPRQAA